MIAMRHSIRGGRGARVHVGRDDGVVGVWRVDQLPVEGVGVSVGGDSVQKADICGMAVSPVGP